MKRKTYRKERAKEMATRDFLAGVNRNPFPEGTMERRVYASEMARSHQFDADLMDMYEVYGGEIPRRRDPDSIQVRPPLEGCP